MRLGIKAKQVLGVATIVGLGVVAVTALSLSSIIRITLEESHERGRFLADAIFHRAREVVAEEGGDPWAALGSDSGLRSILEAQAYTKEATYAAIVDPAGIARVHSDQNSEGSPLAPAGDLEALLAEGRLSQFRSLQSSDGMTLEVRRPLLLNGDEFGSIRIGVSTLLMRDDLMSVLRPAIATAGLALLIAILVAGFLAQLILRPIHLIRGGLSRIEQGEFGVTLDLPQQDEFGELGAFFNTMSARISADRSQLAGQMATLESAVHHLEDAVALFGPDRELLFANPAMKPLLPPDSIGRPLDDILPAGHPWRTLLKETISSRRSCGPVSMPMSLFSADPASDPDAEAPDLSWPGKAPAGRRPSSEERGDGDRLVVTHAIKDLDDHLVGVMMVARDLGYLSRVQSTINYSRKLAALGRLSSGVAHEVKNPLNAMTIHLELLKQKLAAGAPETLALARGSRVSTAGADIAGAMEHAAIISGEIRRLDEVLQGFLKFTRPEDLHLRPIDVCALVEEVIRVIEPEARSAGITVRADCPASTPDVNGDRAMLRQAFLNLALNACQAMPAGGSLRIGCASAPGRRVQVTFEDTGVGIAPEHLQKIFDLYFTTRPGGSGIGLSMVYRTVQMHDGDIEVQSTPGRGTVFSLLLPQA